MTGFRCLRNEAIPGNGTIVPNPEYRVRCSDSSALGAHLRVGAGGAFGVPTSDPRATLTP